MCIAMKVYTGKGYISLFALIAIWMVSAVTSLPGLAISPILEDLSRIFPSASQLEIQMLTSLPSLLIIPLVLLAGWLSEHSGESLKLLAVGLLIFFASGLACIFAKDIRLLIVASCVMGVGAGIVAGYLLCRFVVTPLLAKIKDKKAVEKAKSVTGDSEPKAEES